MQHKNIETAYWQILTYFVFASGCPRFIIREAESLFLQPILVSMVLVYIINQMVPTDDETASQLVHQRQVIKDRCCRNNNTLQCEINNYTNTDDYNRNRGNISNRMSRIRYCRNAASYAYALRCCYDITPAGAPSDWQFLHLQHLIYYIYKYIRR